MFSPKRMYDIAIEKVSEMTAVLGIGNSANIIYRLTNNEKNEAQRFKQIYYLTDVATEDIKNYIFSHLTEDQVSDFLVAFAQKLQTQFLSLTPHLKTKCPGRECIACIIKSVTLNFFKIFLDGRVQKFNTAQYPDDISNITMAFMGNTSTKTDVRITNSHVVLPKVIEGLHRMPTLKYLKIHCKVGNEFLIALGESCPKLEVFVCPEADSEMNDTGFNFLVNGCRKLRSISILASTSITRDCYANALVMLNRLEILEIHGSLLPIIHLVAHKYPKLELKLVGVHVSEDRDEPVDLSVLPVMCPNLRKMSLCFHNLINLQYEVLNQKFSVIGHRLTTIELECFINLLPSEIITIGEQCPKLVELHLTDCEYLGTQNPFENNSNCFPNLEILHFQGVNPAKGEQVTKVEDHLVTILYNAPKLRELYVCTFLDELLPETHGFKLCDDHFARLIFKGKLKHLEVIDLSGMLGDGISVKSAKTLILSLNKLRSLGDISDWNLTPGDIKVLEDLIKAHKLNVQLTTE